jgi:predicted phosphodiesterase
MRLHILADLHFEFGAVDIPDTSADAIVLASDITVGPRGLDWIRYRFPDKPVVYVLGNHEFYQHNLPGLTQSLKREAEGSHIHLLENSAVELYGFTFLGCTLWTDFAVRGNPQRDMLNAETRINDYRIIRFGPSDQVLRAQDTVRIHCESVAWLKSELARHNRARTVVVTHHAPSPRSEAPGYGNGLLSASFVSDLDPLIEQSGIPLWIHGHTHHNVDYRIGATRVLSNQRGYPNESIAGFNAGLVIEI